MSDYSLKKMMNKPERLAPGIVCAPDAVQPLAFVPFSGHFMREIMQ